MEIQTEYKISTSTSEVSPKEYMIRVFLQPGMTMDESAEIAGAIHSLLGERCAGTITTEVADGQNLDTE